jgi:hypothetical protein
VPANPNSRYFYIFGIEKGSGDERIIDNENKYKKNLITFYKESKERKRIIIKYTGKEEKIKT